jgi:hypothetical protein
MGTCALRTFASLEHPQPLPSQPCCVQQWPTRLYLAPPAERPRDPTARMMYETGEVECWGGVLKNDAGAGCDSNFRRGRRHMCASCYCTCPRLTSVQYSLSIAVVRRTCAVCRKNKFCDFCRGRHGRGLELPAERVRGLPEILDETVINSSDGGVWSIAPTVLRDARFRVINNTAVRPARLHE